MLVLLSLCACKKEPLREKEPLPTGPADPAELCTPPVASDAGIGSNACSGTQIDLVRALANPECASPFDPRPPPALYDGALKLTVTPSATKIAPGGHVDVDVSFLNQSTVPLPLTLSPSISLGVVDWLKQPIPIGGTCKALTTLSETEPGYAKITLAPGGVARARVTWNAFSCRWGNPHVQKLPGGCELVRAGPVGKGRYTLHVGMSLWSLHPSGKPDWAQTWPLDHPQLELQVE